ncbi:hypothetical protein ACHAXR_001567, partial [Thalassiosira sp. AJA248-18]
RRWWSSLTDECPITLELLSELPYPPFILTDRAGGEDAGRKSSCSYHFDGLALATYIVSQGTFANPLTRMPLDYADCVRLDEYLNEHIYQNQNHQLQEHNVPSSILGQRGELSVKESWLLRDSIKVKVGVGNNHNDSDRRRAEALRNEASVALRGLFVFGHRSAEGHSHGGDRTGWESVAGQSSNSQTFARAPGGFNLHHNPEPNLDHSWGMNSCSRQEGLHIIDDDEAAFEAADDAAYREVQAAFPHLNGDRLPQQPPLQNTKDDANDPDQMMLEAVRQTANLTLIEEREEAERLERQRQRYFLKALERKRNRITAQRKAKEVAASALSRQKEANDVLQSARDEIDQWRAQQWQEWEHAASYRKSETKSNATSSNIETPPETSEAKREGQPSTILTAEEKAAKAAAKKKAKRQKAKERAKEKKRLENLEAEKKERALALQKEKENSALKCGACGVGILGLWSQLLQPKVC